MNEFGIAIASDTVRIERVLPGPIERVWEYLTDSDKRGRWLARGDMDLRVGGRVEHVFHNNALTDNDDPPPPKYAQYGGEHRMRGRITDCDPPRLLAYSWGEDDGSSSHVRFELHAQGNDTRLTVTHSRLSDRDAMISVAGGWHTHLGILADRLAGREPPGFWRTHTQVEVEYERRIPAA